MLLSGWTESGLEGSRNPRPKQPFLCHTLHPWISPILSCASGLSALSQQGMTSGISLQHRGPCWAPGPSRSGSSSPSRPITSHVASLTLAPATASSLEVLECATSLWCLLYLLDQVGLGTWPHVPFLMAPATWIYASSSHLVLQSLTPWRSGLYFLSPWCPMPSRANTYNEGSSGKQGVRVAVEATQPSWILALLLIS